MGGEELPAAPTPIPVRTDGWMDRSVDGGSRPELGGTPRSQIVQSEERMEWGGEGG